MTVLIEKEAPDFTAEAYHRGERRMVTLSDHREEWVLIFFYPGDFTTV